MESSTGQTAAAPANGEVVASFAFGDERDAPRRARAVVRDALAGAGLAEARDGAELVVTELVTNAVLHGGAPGRLDIRVADGGSVVLEVRDSGPVLPIRARHDEHAMTGRGLALVDSLSARWGVRHTPEGKLVWAEVHAGDEDPLADLDPDALVARWADLEPGEDDAPAREGRVTVRLGDVPTDLLLAAKAHVDNLVREFSLAAAGAREGTTSSLPAHLAELVDVVVHRFGEARDAIKRQALAAARAGEDHVRLELSLPPDAAEAGEAYLRALDEIDHYSRAARLLTLETPPQHRVFRRWYIEELIGQLRHAAEGEARGPGMTFEQRLLREIDTLAAAERTAERGARLHALSSVLASALTPEAVTQAVLGQGLAALGASGGAVLLASMGPRLVLPGAAGYGEQVMARLREEPADAELPAALTLRTGEPVWLESREERDARFPGLVGMEPGTISMCAVPLVASGRRFGALRFSFSEARLFDQGEREFILAMAAQTAQALDRAQLAAHRIEVSERLQRSLLPPRLPEIPGMRVEAAYHPLGDGVDVGGDFYDLWPVADDRWAFAIGDASGTGPEAAAMTALVRHTLRALTLHDMGLETVLHQLNRALRDAQADDDDERHCTVLLGFLTVSAEGARLDVTTGGHPGPLLVRADGGVEELELRGSLMGLFAPAELDRRTIVLGPGDELLLYTDGATDTRRGDGVFFGLGGLIAAASPASRGGASLVAAVSEAVRRHGGGSLGDDLALLSLRYEGLPDAGPA